MFKRVEIFSLLNRFRGFTPYQGCFCGEDILEETFFKVLFSKTVSKITFR